MSMSIYSMNSISNLLNTTFGMSGLYSGLNGGIQGIGGAGSLNALSGLQQTVSSFYDMMQTRQSFNRTELSLFKSATSLRETELQNTAESSDEDAVGATALANATAGTYEVEVNQLAQGQQITGNALDAAAPTAINGGAAGYGQLEFNINGKSQLVTYQLQGGETNEEALNTIAAAVNSRNIGVTANVNVDEAGNATIKMEGASGAANAFTVNDTIGNAAALTSIDDPASVTRNAQNAEFSVNGVDFESKTNQATLGNTGLVLDLKQTTGGAPVDITVQTNATDLEDDTRDFVSQYNETIGNLKSAGTPYAQQSLQNLQTTTGRLSSSLRDIGIDVGAGGELSINTDRFEQAMQERPGTVEAVLQGPAGLASSVQAESERAINQSLSSNSGISFNNFSSNAGFSSYGFSANSMISANLGLFFNNLF